MSSGSERGTRVKVLSSSDGAGERTEEGAGDTGDKRASRVSAGGGRVVLVVVALTIVVEAVVLMASS